MHLLYNPCRWIGDRWEPGRDQFCIGDSSAPAEDRIHQQGNKCISVTGIAYHRIWMKGLLMPDVSCLFQALAGFTDKVYISSHLSPEALLLTRSQRYEGWTGTSALMRSPYVLSSQDLYDTYVTCSEDQRHFSAQSTSTVPLSAERNCCRLESSKMAI